MQDNKHRSAALFIHMNKYCFASICRCKYQVCGGKKQELLAQINANSYFRAISNSMVISSIACVCTQGLHFVKPCVMFHMCPWITAMTIYDRSGSILSLLSPQQREELLKVQARLEDDPTCLDHPQEVEGDEDA